MRLAYFTFTNKNEVAKMNAIEIGNFPDCNMMLQAANISVPNSKWGSKPFVWRDVKRHIICIRSWRDQQSGVEKDKSCIKIVADGFIPVSRFVYEQLKSS